MRVDILYEVHFIIYLIEFSSIEADGATGFIFVLTETCA